MAAPVYAVVRRSPVPILLAALLSLAIAWIRGASPLQLATVQLRWLLLPLLAFTLQFVTFGQLRDLGPGPAVWLQLVGMGLLLVFVAANARYRSLFLVGAGTVLNLLVVTANGGYMPARLDDLERAGLSSVAAHIAAEGHFQKTSALDETTRFPLLGDVIFVPFPGHDRLISPGDVLIGAGVVLFVQEALVRRDGQPQTASRTSRVR